MYWNMYFSRFVFKNMFLLIKTSDLVVKISDYHSVIQNLQVFNNQFVCLVNGRCVNRGEIYLCGGYGIMPERV